ncbi:Protein kinase family protein [Zostera marina]|uniref:Protein kinase family protein n=1 Tax=Zostera marina TaxID=29655 RepID=A0A0K9NJ92_ZOSMR|nr:Protein kinase family protein [Zostera marina]
MVVLFSLFRNRRMCKNKASSSVGSPQPVYRSSSSDLRTTGSSNTNKNKRYSLSTSSSGISATDLKDSLPDAPILYSLAEIRSATNNFVNWHCNIGEKETVVCRRDFKGDPSRIKDRLSSVCRINHSSVIKVVGACVCASNSIFIVHEYVKGASLADCLRNPKNPSFSPLSSWILRMEVATDIGKGLEYIHQSSGGSKIKYPIHNEIKSSNIIITDPGLRAKICHFGTTTLTGENESNDEEEQKPNRNPSSKKKLPTYGNHEKKFKATKGYIAPEIIVGGGPSQKTDVYALGVVLLEILSGEKPITHKYEGNTLESFSLVETARDVLASDIDEEDRHIRLRRWVDRRLKDSFPVDVAENVLELALKCVNTKAERRPDMTTVAARLSKYHMKSTEWANKINFPTDLSITYGPR